jgi:hypothetical protein
MLRKTAAAFFLSGIAAAAPAHAADQRTSEVLDLFKGTCASQPATAADIDDQARTYWTGEMRSYAGWNHDKPSVDSQSVWTVHAPTGDIILQADILGSRDNYRLLCRIKAGPVNYDELVAGVKAIMDLPDPTSDTVDANNLREIKWVVKKDELREVDIRYAPGDKARVAWIEMTRKIK